jgi:hypothetical protein
MLSEKELRKIYSWLPYQEEWPIDRNQKQDGIDRYYGKLIGSIVVNDVFDSYYSQDGGLGNYLEFFCYPKMEGYYRGNAIQICISLCAPLYAYGQNTVQKTIDSFGWRQMFAAESIGLISDPDLLSIETELNRIMKVHKLTLLTSELAAKELPQEVVEEIQLENHNAGTQVLQGIFQKVD